MLLIRRVNIDPFGIQENSTMASKTNREEKDMDQSEYIPIVKGIMPWFSEDILG